MFQLFLVAFMSIFLAGCGGGGGSSSIGTEEALVATESELTGKVIDGYISGATVCLDLNNNYTCDPDEPSALSGAGGSYTFTYEGTIPEGIQILADIPIGAVDEDLGVVDKPYSMLAPAAHPEVVTPLTTLVSQEIQSSAGQLTPEEAEKSVKLMLNIDESDSLLGNDFVANEDTDLQATATFVAEVLAVAKDAITKNPATSELTSAQISKASVQTAKSITSDLIASGSSISLAIEDVAMEVTTVVTGQINNIVAASKSGDGEVVSLIQEIKEGNLIILSEGGNEIDEGGSIEYREGLEMEFVYFPDAVEGQLVNITSAGNERVAMLVYDGPRADTWVPIDWDDDVEYRIADTGKWTLTSDLESTGTKISENCAIFYETGIIEPSSEICFIRKDVSGKQVRDIVPDFCSDGQGGVLEGCDPLADLPSDSFVYDASLTIAENEFGGEYILWGGDGWGGYLAAYANEDQTIQGFIDGFLGEPNRYASKGDDCNTAFRIKSYDTEDRSGLIEWADASDRDCNVGFVWADADTTETLPFTVEEVGSETILKTRTPVVLRVNNPDERDPYLIFGQAPNLLGEDEDGIYSGSFAPSGYKLTYAFTGNVDYAIFASRVFVDFMLEQAGDPEFPYEEFLDD
ncbi:MAG: hypothetical protein HON72_00420 [Porticoccaceae bacterium]|nr:hypothetical protein [Porticoccaceae bacterium]